MNKPNNNITVAAGIAGAVIGAGVTAATVALSDKKTREKVLSTLHDAREHAMDMMDSKKKDVEAVHKKVDEAIEDGEKTVYRAKDETDKIAKTL